MAPRQFLHLNTSRRTLYSSSEANHEANKAESGMWKCCTCSRVHKFHLRPGRHPVGSIFCRCTPGSTHKPCEECQFAGPLKYFVPIQEPLTIETPDTDKGEDIPYGVICKKCGTSWRATRTIGHQKTSTKETRMKRCPTRFFSLPTQSSKARNRRSVFDFGQVYDTSQAGKHFGSGAYDASHVETSVSSGGVDDTAIRSTDIQFSGLKCTCGSVSRADTSFCFRTVQGDRSGLQEDGRRTPLSYHDGPSIDIRGTKHPNPLRSNPV